MRIGLISLSILYVIQLVTEVFCENSVDVKNRDLALGLGASIKEPGVEGFSQFFGAEFVDIHIQRLTWISFLMPSIPAHSIAAKAR